MKARQAGVDAELMNPGPGESQAEIEKSWDLVDRARWELVYAAASQGNRAS